MDDPVANVDAPVWTELAKDWPSLLPLDSVSELDDPELEYELPLEPLFELPLELKLPDPDMDTEFELVPAPESEFEPKLTLYPEPGET